MENIIHGFTDKTENTPGFEWRKSKTEFLRDGEMIKALYEKIEDILETEHGAYQMPDRTLRVFNFAYDICRKLAAKNYLLLENPLVDTDHNPTVRTLALTLAVVLLIENGSFDRLDKNIKERFTLHIPQERVWELLSIARKHSENNTFHPGKTCTQPPTTTQTGKVDFSMAKKLLTTVLNTAEKLEEENSSIKEKLEDTYKTCERKTKEIARLNKEATDLRQQLEAWENNKFYQAVNISTIVEYAQKQENCDLKIIKLMLLELCANRVDNEVIQQINGLKCGGNTNIGHVGQFYQNPDKVINENHYHYHNENPETDE